MTDILKTVEDGILTLTINRVAKKNSLTTAMYTMIAESLEGAARDASIGVAIIQGSPEVFSAGNDLADFVKNPPRDETAPVWKFLTAISSFPKPLLASVSGAAVGVGATLLLHCDVVYASTTAKLSFPFVNLGLCPEAGSTLLLPQLFGYQRSAKLLMFGGSVSAEEARDVGLFSDIVAPEDVNAFTRKQAMKLLEKPAESLLQSKRLLKLASAGPTKAQIKAESVEFIKLLDGPDFKEAVTAFGEKRAPTFKR